jgi:hypothetical protein
MPSSAWLRRRSSPEWNSERYEGTNGISKKEECNPNIAKFRMGCYFLCMAGLTRGERTLMREVINHADFWTPRLETHVGRLEPPLVLFTEDNVPRIDRPVDGKDSIEVVDLMLQQLG